MRANLVGDSYKNSNIASSGNIPKICKWIVDFGDVDL